MRLKLSLPILAVFAVLEFGGISRKGGLDAVKHLLNKVIRGIFADGDAPLIQQGNFFFAIHFVGNVAHGED